MRKFFAIIMLLIVPVQLAWASCDFYTHDDLPNAFTHQAVSEEYHQHSQKVEKGSSLAKQDPQNEKYTAHCDACHAHLITLVDDDHSLIWKTRHNEASPFYKALLVSTLPDPPYRPKWHNS